MSISIDELELYIDMLLARCQDCYKINSCNIDLSEFKFPEICSTISKDEGNIQ